MYWIYKCNMKGHEHQRAIGDWTDFFNKGGTQRWGSTEWAKGLRNANIDDIIIAYQTDRNELVGLAKVIKWQTKGKYHDLFLKPFETIGVKVRPLKDAYPKINSIPALRPGPIQTLFAVSNEDAKRLLHAAGVKLRPDPLEAEDNVRINLKGAGFGSPDQNKRVEKAAMHFVMKHYRAGGWNVEDVSRDNRGFDLICQKGQQRLHVEVKGSSGASHKFIITSKEKRAWQIDKYFILALATNALEQPLLTIYDGSRTLKKFVLTPLSYIATLQK